MKILYKTIALILFFSNILLSNAVASDKQNIKILNIINHQRMLSQQITKAYLYAGNKINTDEANKEIYRSLKELKNSFKKINRLTKNQKVKNSIYFVKNSTTQFSNISSKPLNAKNAKLMLDLSESILNQSEQTILLLKNSIQNSSSKFIEIMGQQQMLAQRIAKYYMAYQLDKSENTKRNMKNSIENFARNHKLIMKYKGNNPKIKQKLKEIDRLWKIANKFYINIEKGELPLIVFETTDNITHKMNYIIKIYTLQIK